MIICLSGLALLNLHKLNYSHFGVVTLPWHSSQHTSVTSIAIPITVRCGLEQRMNQILIIHPCKSLTSGMQISPLSQLNHVIDVFADSLRSHGGGLDASVTDDFGGQGAKKGFALIRRFSELSHPLSVTHHGQF